MPCYRSTLHIEAAYSIVRDAVWATRAGHEIQPYYRAGWSVERARNHALKTAIANGFDVLLMQDADVFAVGGLEHLVQRWEECARPAVLGAAVPLRRNAAMNCEPYRPGEVFEGVVGAGMILIDVAQLAHVPPPWFTVTFAPDGSEVETGEDIAFCRLVRASGLRVMIDANIVTGHADEIIHRSFQ